MAIIGTRFRQKPRYSAHIMIGGTDWISLALPLMAIFLPHDFKLVDQMVGYLYSKTWSNFVERGGNGKGQEVGPQYR